MTYPNMLAAPAGDRRQYYESIRYMLESERSSFISLWRNLNDFIMPTRGRFQTSDNNRGDRRSPNIIDSTATLAVRAMAAGMMSGVTSPARPWFRITTADPDLAEHGAVKQWLQTCTERMRWILSRSNFYNKCYTLYKDLGVFGTSALFSVEDDHDVVRFHDFPIGSFSVAVGYDGRVTILTRIFRMTARQMVAEFGIENVSEGVRANMSRGSNSEGWYEVSHIIMANQDYEPRGMRSSINKPWISCYYETGAPARAGKSQFLRESGFNEMPVFVPIWEGAGEDIYGTDCPGIMALGDVRQLQAMERRGLQGLEKMVNPPMVGPTELASVRTSILPGDITYVNTRDGQQGFRAAHETQIRLDQLEMKEQPIRGRINECFYKDMFQMIAMMDEQREGKQPITAAEVFERHEEKLLMLGPVLEQLDSRLLDPSVHRLFSIMTRRGFIPPPPPDMQAGSLKIEYISTMHQAQKSVQMAGYNALISFITPLAEIDPSVIDKLGTDKIIEHVNDSLGNPPDSMRPQEEVDKLRQARSQAAQEDKKMEQLKQQADAAKKLSQADTSKKNALTDVTKNGGGNEQA